MGPTHGVYLAARLHPKGSTSSAVRIVEHAHTQSCIGKRPHQAIVYQQLQFCPLERNFVQIFLCRPLSPFSITVRQKSNVLLPLFLQRHQFTMATSVNNRKQIFKLQNSSGSNWYKTFQTEFAILKFVEKQCSERNKPRIIVRLQSQQTDFPILNLAAWRRGQQKRNLAGDQAPQCLSWTVPCFHSFRNKFTPWSGVSVRFTEPKRRKKSQMI